MGSAESREILSLLRDIEDRSRRNAVGLPQQTEFRRFWEGVLFSVSGVRLAAALGELMEILNFPAAVTPVPGTHAWVRGVANVRGSLLPIVDLQQFLGGRAAVTDRRSRVLVIRHEATPVGLLVGEVFGMRHFPEETRGEAPYLDGKLARFVQSTYQHDMESWPVLSVPALSGDPEFQVAAA